MVLSLNQFFGKINKKIRGLLNEADSLSKVEKKSFLKIKKKLDLICLGRLAVDFYGEQIGSRLEDMSSFSKYLGGSSANVAYGAARQGLRSSMLARVGDEHMGRFLKEELARGGVDTSNIITYKERLTALVILGIKDKETFPLIFYRYKFAYMDLNK